jgi:hypothetical protein
MQEAEYCRPLCSRPRGRTFGATWVTSGATALLGHQLRVTLQVALGALALAFGGAHALASVPELRHDARLLVLSNESGMCRIMTREGSLVSVRSSPFAVNMRTPRLMSARRPSSWDNEVAGEAAGVLNEDRVKDGMAGRYPNGYLKRRASRRAGRSSVCGRPSFTRSRRIPPNHISYVIAVRKIDQPHLRPQPV